MGISSFTQLDVWKIAHRITLSVYKTTRGFPDDERFGLTSQARKAAVSVAANIAEGFGRRQPRDKMRFYNMSQGSLEELRYYFILAKDLGYSVFPGSVHEDAKELGAKLNRLIDVIARDV
ncbi:MAG TPA: four helix bundle protein [Planctomycetota bacterium]|nr:four helix bundle protein [Planctomycetota bacterium]